MSAINYSKWDALELSDDSDIECHPNVDKRSLIRWKQEQIHREREERRTKIKKLKEETTQMRQQLTKYKNMRQMIETNGVDLLTNAMSEFRNVATQSNILTPENEEQWNKVEAELSPEVAHARYLSKMQKEQDELQVEYDKAKKELDDLEKVENRKLTADKLREGFNKTAVTKVPQVPKETPKKKTTEKKRVIETLNPGSANGVPAKASSPSNSQESDDSDEEVDVSELALEFSRVKGFDESLKYISKHPYLATQKYSDEIMAQAFKSQMDGDESYANNCVHQALILQYCAQLGKDGVGLFFHRIRDTRHGALKIFENDWKDTYARIKSRCKVLVEERAAAGGVETIQLQAAEPGTQIQISGPPADADPKVHEIFLALPEDFQEAILSSSLEKVNKSLEGMSVQLAEEVVRVCNQVGFLSIEGDIIDTTKGETIEQREAEMAAKAAAEGNGTA
ncbi:hsp90 co-chaperone Cdc37 [Actinomortierella ambigua]|nr:hsp90 co-chaperone Cdc37 [Actinomortierella ambigua]